MSNSACLSRSIRSDSSGQCAWPDDDESSHDGHLFTIAHSDSGCCRVWLVIYFWKTEA